ncbi:TLC domain-containing protein [Mortierella sp. GBAus27b]|nr:TLC domain-containing protein [Mortierella sp. GBAus27b]
MNLNSPHVPLSLIASLTLYPVLFAALRRQPWIREILPRRADTQKHYHLCNKMVASTHSTIMTLAGAYLLMSVDWSQNDISTYKSSLTPFLVGLELGYLTQDTFFEFYQRAVFGVGSNLILFHHVAVILGSVYYLHALILTSPGPYFIGMLSLMNLSTPILHLRWALQSRGRTFFNSRLKRVVDTSLLLSYFWSRIVGNWWMSVAIGTKLGVVWYQAPLYIGKKFTITSTTMFVMNLIWWLVLMRQWFGSAQAFYLGGSSNTTTSSTPRTRARLQAKKTR